MKRSSGLVSCVVLAAALALSGSAAAQPKGGGKPAPPKPVPAPVKPAAVDVNAEIKKMLGDDEGKAAQGAQRLGDTRDPRALVALLDALALGLSPKVAAAALESVGNFK